MNNDLCICSMSFKVKQSKQSQLFNSSVPGYFSLDAINFEGKPIPSNRKPGRNPCTVPPGGF